MKNSNIFPFERNKYFYGKLLSVDDFELEQKYMNDKRRMQNRFLFGAGVVAGLYVVQVDEQTISVEAGLAFDSWGREMVVDVPVIKKLSMIDGFADCMQGDADVAYLCLEYEERETQQVHNIAGDISDGQENGVSYNKVAEGFRLFLTAQEPEEILSPAGWYQTSQVIYQEGDIRITQIMPRYIRSQGVSEIKIAVENRGRSNVSFSYELILNHLLSEGKARIFVSFDEVLSTRSGHYEITYPIRAGERLDEDGTAVINPETVILCLSGVQQEVDIEGKMSVAIVDEDEKTAMQREYYRTSMEKIMRTGYRQPVYLAKLQVVSASRTYIIENIENVPFGQYVSNHVMETALGQLIHKELTRLADGGAEGIGDEGGQKRRQERPEEVAMAQGIAEISLEGGGERGAKFFSDEIVHTLGMGKVTLLVGLEKESGKVVYGSSEIFEDSEEAGVDAELAACVNEENGSFVIGVRLLSSVAQGMLRVRWCALRDRQEVVQEKNEKRIFIKPNLLELQVRESHYLEAVCENMVEKKVIWSVRDEGGFIDADGRYTAPNVPGVYEVVAQSVAFENVKASIFVVVREV